MPRPARPCSIVASSIGLEIGAEKVSVFAGGGGGGGGGPVVVVVLLSHRLLLADTPFFAQP